MTNEQQPGGTSIRKLLFSHFSALTLRCSSIDLHVLCKQILCGVIDVIIGKRGHGVVAVVVVWRESDIDSLLLSDFFGCRKEVLGEELALFVEVVSSSLFLVGRG